MREGSPIPLQDLRTQKRQQERPAFHDEAQGAFEKRRIPTPEDRKEMDTKLDQLSDLLSGTSVRWQLDGALNISLLKGDYIGVHKDVDLFVEPEDLEDLEKHLYTQGYAFFLTVGHEDPNKKGMVWATAGEIRESEKDRSLVAIDKNGNIRFDHPLNFIDVHLVKRNAEGKPLGYQQVELPESWYTPRPFLYRGKKIFLSHPAKVAYFKLHCGRPYDLVDLQELAATGTLTLEDMDTIEEILCKEEEAIKQRTEFMVRRVAPQIKKGMTGETLYQIFSADPEIAALLKTKKDAEDVHTLIHRLANETDLEKDSVRCFFENITNQKNSTQRQHLLSLRKAVEDALSLT